MNKKSKTVNKTKPRRAKGRVYTLPEANKVIIDALSDISMNIGESPKKITEDICSKARRLANEAEETKKKERAERELAFMKKMFETEDLAGAGVVMDKVRDDGTIEYLICGRRWVYGEELYGVSIQGLGLYTGYLINLDTYLNFFFSFGCSVYRASNLKDFGILLRYMDEREVQLRAKYPDNWWGRFKAKWA